MKFILKLELQNLICTKHSVCIKCVVKEREFCAMVMSTYLLNVRVQSSQKTVAHNNNANLCICSLTEFATILRASPVCKLIFRLQK